MEAAGLAGNLLQLVVERDRVALQLRHVGVAVQRVEAARRRVNPAPRQVVPEKKGLPVWTFFAAGLGFLIVLFTVFYVAGVFK